MRKRITSPKLVAIATVDATSFVFPESREVIEKNQRRRAFFKLRK